MAKYTVWDYRHFFILDSTIQSAGKGLFSRVTIEPGDTIGRYTGLVLSDEEVNKPPYLQSEYVLWVCKDCNIVAEGPRASYVRYINHHDEPNARFVTSTRWKTARVEATSLIRPGEEIFVDYGPFYWEQMKHIKSPEQPESESGSIVVR